MNYSEGTLSVFPAGSAKGLPPGEQVALAWLWVYKSQGNAKLPSLNSLAADCGMSKRAIITQIQSLVTKGKVIITKRVSESGSNEVNLYELPIGGEISSPDVVELTSQGKKGKPKWDARPYLIVWKDAYGGYFPVDRAAQPLKRAEKDFGRETVVAALKNYCKNTKGIYASIHAFTSKVGIWIPKDKPREYDSSVVDGSKRW